MQEKTSAPSRGWQLPASFFGLQNWIWQPLTTNTHIWQNIPKILLRIVSIFFKKFTHDNISLRSAALTFTIVLSLVPALALGTAVLKGLGGGDQMRNLTYRFIHTLESSLANPMDIDQNNTAPPVDTILGENKNSETAPIAPQEQSPSVMAQHMRKAADQIFDYVDKTNFATIGAFGVAGLVISVLNILWSIEQSMNVIWQADSGRPFSRKLMDYMALIVLLPLSVNLALAMETTIQSQSLFTLLNKLLPIAWLTGFMLKLLPIILVVITFTVLYQFLPNTKVKLLPALAGGAIGGICWILTQSIYLMMQIGVARYNAIYGSFATLPLFMLWLYAGWLIFLAGAEVAFSCQAWQTYEWKKIELTPRTTLHLAFKTMEEIFETYNQGSFATSKAIANRLHCTEREISVIFSLLTSGGVLRQVLDRKTIGYVPAIPQDRFAPDKIIELIFGPQHNSEHPLSLDVFQAAKDSVHGKWLTAPCS